VLIDTAGRLHNKANLMEELAKIIRVIKKFDTEAPHDIVLTLDATTGQNAYQQLDVFASIVPLTGMVITKLDGTAKGGMVIQLAEKFKLPVYAVGFGEAIEDLGSLEPENFAKALIGAS